MSKKANHRLLQRLLTVTQRRIAFTSQVERYRRQRQWLIDLEHLLDPTPEQEKPTSLSVSQAVDGYLVKLIANPVLDDEDRQVAEYINQIFRNVWWGLFACYDIPGLPRTNNELERFIRQLKTSYRRISGRKNVHDFIIRYGAYAALVDENETLTELLSRLAEVEQAEFLKERNRLNLSLQDEVKLFRFRFHRQEYLADLESRWSASANHQNT